MAYSDSGRPAPEALRQRLSPTQLDDPLFRAAAAATVYQPGSEPPPHAAEQPAPEPESDIPLPPEIWPGL